MTLRFNPMSDSDFQMYLRRAIPQYAYDQVRGGNWQPDESVGRARAEFEQSLPNGPHTPGHFFYTIMDERGDKVGMLWWAMNQRGIHKIAFVADFFIFSESRNKGYEAESLTMLENEVDKCGAERIELQVFAHNTDDLFIYRNNGFSEVSIYFGKDISKSEKP